MNNPWKPAELEMLVTVDTLSELAEAALSVLRRMSNDGEFGIVQICGPISTGGFGNTQQNIKFFKSAIRTAIEKEVLVFDQFPFHAPFEKLRRGFDGADNEWNLKICEEFYKVVLGSGFIKILWFLPKWESSFGTRWERNFSKELGLTAEEYPTEWLIPVL